MARSLRSLSGSIAAAPTHRAIFAPHPKTSACHHPLSQRQPGLACDPHLNHADRLASTPDVVDALISIEDPIESLLRRGDIITFRAEAYNGRLDLPQIKADAVARDDLGRREFVAYEKVIDHVLQLFSAQQNEIA